MPSAPPVAPPAALLDIDRLITGYGSAPVLHEVNLSAARGDITVILGANGVGKTTCLRTVAGLLPVWKGSITFDGRTLHRMRADERVRQGIGLVPEPPAVFRDLSVLDNLRVGAMPLGRSRRRVQARVDAVLDGFPKLRQRSRQIAGSLSGGEQRMLAVARALAAEPRLLLVDEASMGLSPTMVSEVLGMLNGLREYGLSLCIVEQNVAALDIADRVYVMEKGRVAHTAASGDIDALRAAAAQVYLGANRAPAKGRGR
jgi:branched-chain amino acid transport system ATP-binding protein